jgi:Tfp pilus assembly PilM family ATPase
MSSAIVLQLASDKIRAVVTRASGESLLVDAIETVPIVGTDLTAAEKQLSAALEDHHPTKARVLLAVPSSSIRWQYLTLPPCPPEDLPALVKLQLELESSRDDEQIGYDFLPLAGNAERPQRVLAMILKVADLARVRNLGRVSGMRIDAVVPMAMGWPAREVTTNEQAAEVQVFVALENKEATIWATSNRELALLRQVQLAEEWESPGSTAFLAGQIRRTMLSLAQEGIATEAAPVFVLGEPAESLEQLAASLGQQLGRSVQAARPKEVVLPTNAQAERGELSPLLGLAWQAVRNQAPQLDFLHPRKPPAPQSQRRTMVLAGIAATMLASLIGWQGYAALNNPLVAAEELEDELSAVNQELEPLQAEERDAARIRDWLAASPNVLTELAELSKDWRPQPFDASDFAIAKDGVLKRIEINNRRVTLTGNVANSAAVQPLENRLRDGGHRVRREQSEPAADGGQYPWQVQVVVDIVDGQPTEPQP